MAIPGKGHSLELEAGAGHPNEWMSRELARRAGQALRMARLGSMAPVEGRCRPYNPKILGEAQPRWDEPLAGANRQNFVKSSKVTPQNRSFNSPVWRVKKASQEENPNPGNQVTVGKRDTLQSEGPFLTWTVRSRNSCLTNPS